MRNVTEETSCATVLLMTTERAAVQQAPRPLFEGIGEHMTAGFIKTVFLGTPLVLACAAVSGHKRGSSVSWRGFSENERTRKTHTQCHATIDDSLSLSLVPTSSVPVTDSIIRGPSEVRAVFCHPRTRACLFPCQGSSSV